MAEDAALQRWTVQVEAVHVVLRGVVVKNGQITGNCKRKRKVTGLERFDVMEKVNSQFLVRQQVRLHLSALSSW